MPWATPMRTSRSESARATMSWPSTRPPPSTPTISAGNSSTESPRKTVRTTARSPGWSSSGAMVAGRGGAPRAGRQEQPPRAPAASAGSRVDGCPGRTAAHSSRGPRGGQSRRRRARACGPAPPAPTLPPCAHPSWNAWPAARCSPTAPWARCSTSAACPSGTASTRPTSRSPALVESVHRDYLAAGAELIETNTFGANHLRLLAYGLEHDVRLIARQGARVARAAREVAGTPAFVAGSIGPLGRALQPFGQIAVADAERWFQATRRGPARGRRGRLHPRDLPGPERDPRRAARRAPGLRRPAGDRADDLRHGRQDALRALPRAGGAGAAAGGRRRGGRELRRRARRRRSRCSRRWCAPRRAPPVSAMPNAGLPHLQGGRFHYLASPAYFAEFAARAVEAGRALVGGCCGTTPGAHARDARAAAPRACRPRS